MLRTGARSEDDPGFSLKNISCVENQVLAGAPRLSSLHSSFPGELVGPQRVVYASTSRVYRLGS